MNLYELDSDGNDWVDKLYFPKTSVTLTCHYEGCSEQTTGWKDKDYNASSMAEIDAKLRMTVAARLEGSCDWNW